MNISTCHLLCGLTFMLLLSILENNGKLVNLGPQPLILGGIFSPSDFTTLWFYYLMLLHKLYSMGDNHYLIKTSMLLSPFIKLTHWLICFKLFPNILSHATQVELDTCDSPSHCLTVSLSVKLLSFIVECCETT